VLPRNHCLIKPSSAMPMSIFFNTKCIIMSCLNTTAQVLLGVLQLLECCPSIRLRVSPLKAVRTVPACIMKITLLAGVFSSCLTSIAGTQVEALIAAYFANITAGSPLCCLLFIRCALGCPAQLQ